MISHRLTYYRNIFLRILIVQSLLKCGFSTRHTCVYNMLITKRNYLKTFDSVTCRINTY